MPSPLPLYWPPGADRLFQSESLVRRMAQLARWDSGTKILEFFGSVPGLSLASALGCELTVLGPAGAAAQALEARARAAGLGGGAKFETGDVMQLGYGPGSFNGILSLGRVTGNVADEAKRLRPLLAPRGRVALTVVVKVGRRPEGPLVSGWESRLGAPLPQPREALMQLEAAGFEPELSEVADEAGLAAAYASFASALEKATDASAAEREAAAAELALHTQHGSAGGVSFAIVFGRRKEPGEKPPVSRDNG